MNYYKQLLTVTMWEYKRFYKIKNELIGIIVMLILFSVGYFGGKFAVKGLGEKQDLLISEDAPAALITQLESSYNLQPITASKKENTIQQLETEKEGMLLWEDETSGFVLYAYKKPGRLNRLQEGLDEYNKLRLLEQKNLTTDDYDLITGPAALETRFVYQPTRGRSTTIALFFAGIMVMAVFVSFAYQFTAITGEKQLKITEQIVSAIKPQVWMDGKILGITLTGLSSMVAYTILSILGGMLYFVFTGKSVSQIEEYVHLPAILMYFLFTTMGILLWNAMMAAVASVITDPNNSGKGSLMMLPVLFVLASLFVLAEPDNSFAVFLSWFPLTSATAMPMRWISTEIAWWEVTGSFVVLTAAFYFLRKLAAVIFRVSILISGKEPSWSEVYRLAREK
jgi:ABC-2 type transport system permease protein